MIAKKNKAIALLLVIVVAIGTVFAAGITVNAQSVGKKSGPKIKQVTFTSKEGGKYYKATAKCSKKSEAIGYQFWISASRNFAGDCERKNSNTNKVTFKSKYSGGSKYYVRVRACIRKGKTSEWTKYSKTYTAYS